MDVRLKPAHEPAAPADAYRVLIDRLWPRGLPRRRARLDDCYIEELRSEGPRLAGLRRRAREGTLTLVYSAHDAEHNDAVVSRDGAGSKPHA